MEYYDQFQGITQTSSYDEKTALSLAIACDLAYETDETKIAAIVKSWGFNFEGFKSVIKKRDIHTQCYVMSNAENIIVVFRGSESLNDWFTNFQIVYDPGPLEDTKAHEGFQDALFPAVIGITNLIDAALKKDKKIWVTGHSLGGALCSLYAGMLVENAYEVYGVYTFASPRPGNGAFEAKLNQSISGPHYRVVNTGDFVPHVPPEPFYSHPGERIILQEESRENSGESWLSQRISALEMFIENTADMLDVANNHRLSKDEESYIPPRLIKDLQRAGVQQQSKGQ